MVSRSVAAFVVVVALGFCGAAVAQEGCTGLPLNVFTPSFGVTLHYGTASGGACLGVQSTGMYGSGAWLAVGKAGTAGMVGGGEVVLFSYGSSSGRYQCQIERLLTTTNAQPGTTTSFDIYNATGSTNNNGYEFGYYFRSDLAGSGRLAVMFAASQQQAWPAMHSERHVACVDFDTASNTYAITSNYADAIAACNSPVTTTTTAVGAATSGTTASITNAGSITTGSGSISTGARNIKTTASITGTGTITTGALSISTGARSSTAGAGNISTGIWSVTTGSATTGNQSVPTTAAPASSIGLAVAPSSLLPFLSVVWCSRKFVV